MNLFLDNNVLVGYIFETDHWNSMSLNVMSQKTPKYSSSAVKTECNHKYTSSLRKIKIEFNRFKKQMRKSNSLKDIEFYLNDTNFNTKDILLDLLKSDSNANFSDFIKMFRTLQWKVEATCHSNYEHLLQVIHFHERNKPYKILYDLCTLDGFVNDDNDDVEIVIDAHDLGLELQNLFFVTGDYKHIVSRKQFIVENTSISDVIGLGEFNLT